MRTVTASEFKAKCLQLMDEVVGSGATLVITKNGKPVAELTPARQGKRTLIGTHSSALAPSEESLRQPAQRPAFLRFALRSKART